MLWIVGVVLLLGGAGLAFGAASQRKKLALMQGTQTSSAAELRTLAESVGKEIGAGSFAETAELKGAIRCEKPLVSELAAAECVYYTMRVTREYEETTWDTDSKGNRVQRNHRGSETVSENTRSCPFEVEDPSGRLAVDPSGASMTGEKVYDRFEPGEPRSPSLSVGRWRFDIGSLGLGSGRRTLGYKYEESIVPVGKQVYVLGEASDAGGQLAVRKPTKKGTTFLISLKSEEELAKSASGSATGLMVGAAIAGVGGVVVLLLDLLGVI